MLFTHVGRRMADPETVYVKHVFLLRLLADLLLQDRKYLSTE